MDTLIFGTDDKSYRIPSIITTTTPGTLLSFCEARIWGVEDMGRTDIVLRRSLDFGKSWNTVQTVWSSGQVSRNPCPVVDVNTGRIHLLMTFNEECWEELDILAGNGYCEPFACYSDDNGLTWSEPISIVETAKDPSWRWYATGPGNGIQLSSGRLVVPCNHSVACLPEENERDDIYHSHIIYSDDGGLTWLKGESQPEYTNESAVVELNNGSLLHNMRHQVEYYRGVGISKDGGETWESYQLETFPRVPVCQGSLLRLNDHTILFSCPKELNRNAQTIYFSEDECESWKELIELYPGSSGYSSMARITDYSFAILYERDFYNKIVVRLVELDQNMQVKEPLIPI